MSALPKHLLPTRPQNLQNLFESCRKILYTDKNSAKRMVHMYTKNEVLEFISENDVKFIRLAFATSSEHRKTSRSNRVCSKKPLKPGIPVNASLIAGFGDKTADVYLMPNPSTMAVLPMAALDRTRGAAVLPSAYSFRRAVWSLTRAAF